MGNRGLGRVFLVAVALLPLRVGADEASVWEPITSADWGVVEDPAKGIRNAVMLFEKTVADDARLREEKCYLTTYRRIKILNSEGRKWGDVSLPYLQGNKVLEIRGRTVLPDGQEFPLSDRQVHEKEVFKSNEIRVHQKSFSLPGISDGCIVEYFVKYQSPRPNNLWRVQRETALLRGEYRWVFYRGADLPQPFHAFIAEKVAPYSLWLNNSLTVEEPGHSRDAPEKVFVIRDVPAFEREPYAQAEVARQIQLRLYYGESIRMEDYWGDISYRMSQKQESFCRKNSRIREAVSSFGALPSDEARIGAAYRWLQLHLRNVTYLKDDDPVRQRFKENETADEALKSGTGTRDDINLMFCAMLREMKMEANVAYVVDRDENLFEPDAKYWQFDRSLVVVRMGGDFRFCSPGDLHLPSTMVPWVDEGVESFPVGGHEFIKTPYSGPGGNQTSRRLALRLGDDLGLEGGVWEHRSGHGARAVRLKMANVGEAEGREKLKAELSGVLPKARMDSVSVTGLDDPDAPLILMGRFQIPGFAQSLGARLSIQPFILFSPGENPFQAERRRHPILFDYAHETADTLEIALPEAWKVEAVPTAVLFANRVGRCEARFKVMDQTLSVVRQFRLNQAFWSVADYPAVRELFEHRQALDALTVVLKKNPSAAGELEKR